MAALVRASKAQKAFPPLATQGDPAITGTKWFAKITAKTIATIITIHSARLPIQDDCLCFIGVREERAG
jgi:hypothetical protein